MSTLREYCEQVYNPGSPNPTPDKILRRMSTSTSSNIPLSAKLAANAARSSKRPLEKEGPSVSPEPKNARVDKDVMREVGEELFKEFLPKIEVLINAAVDKIEEKIERKVEEKIQPIKQNIVEIEKAQIDIDKRVTDLEKAPPVNIEEIRESIVPGISSNLMTGLDTQWRLFLTEEIKKTECCLIVKGLEEDKLTREGFTDFCEKGLKMPEADFQKLDIYNISGSRGGKSESSILFVTLGSSQQRNSCFKFAKNAPQNVKLDQHVPKNYLKKYREFQNEGWKLRLTNNFQTRIDFGGANLTLRYKKKDTDEQKFAWTIAKEFCPKAEKPTPRTPFTPLEGCLPTPPIPDMDTTVILSNVGRIEKEKISEIFAERDQEAIANIEEKRPGIFVLLFSSKERSAETVKKYNGKVVNGKKISMVKL